MMMGILRQIDRRHGLLLPFECGHKFHLRSIAVDIVDVLVKEKNSEGRREGRVMILRSYDPAAIILGLADRERFY